ncbi:group II intron maturase-specific domain-containing protein [Burkholderia multivorans]|uniref:group II intron maturase-specific domain-containing protein n=1 Tax=Burkholderia multivorans TaxID=87883 RepID=UPI0030C8975F
MSLERAVHQKPASAGRNAGGRGEAEPEAVRDEARPARFATGGSGRDDLLSQALARANLVMAWKRVKANRGSAGVDGKSIAETAEYLKTHWPGIRELTRRSGGRSLPESVERLRAYLLGWKAYFQLVQTPKVLRALDEWIRHRLRAMQLKHWRRGTTMYRGLLALGASEADARKLAANSCSWWHNSRLRLNRAMPIAYFDRLGVPRLS